MARRIGKQTIAFDKQISVLSTASVVGPMEGEGPLGKYFDVVLTDDECGEDSYEKAETCMLTKAYDIALRKAKMSKNELDLFIGGDLLNQIIATTFAVEQYDVPYWGVYNACSTFSLAIQIASTAIEAGGMRKVMASASSHFSSAERQYRTPLELGCQNPITAQRTTTAAGCCILGESGQGPYVTQITTGRIIDFDVKDPFNMGTAMAPAAADTILAHFKDTGTSFEDYDLVVTGDLASMGLEITENILKLEGYHPKNNFTDCGKMIFDPENQKVDLGGSGAGCSASVFAAVLYEKLKSRKLNNVLLVPTGALLSPTSSLQKQSIPCIAHAVALSNHSNKKGANA